MIRKICVEICYYFRINWFIFVGKEDFDNEYKS